MQYAKPRRLVRGSHVRIVSPSGPIGPELVEQAAAVLESWGLRVSVDPAAFDRHAGYLAGPDAARRAAVQRAIDDPHVDAILFSRGGYGAMRIVADVDLASLRRDPRVVCGFSDITALHLRAQTEGLATLHGHVAKSFSSQAADLELLRRTWFGERGTVIVEVTPVCAGIARGPVIGGNLSLVAAMAGSRFVPRLDGAVLFVEEVTEEDYRLDRLLTSLRLNPRFEGLAAVVLGGFDDCEGTYVDEDEIGAFVRGLAEELGEHWRVPVVMDFPSGHADRNVPIPLGVPATVDADAGTVTFDEELVS